MGTLDPNAFDSVTFDCYGTLIDWETGILAGIGPVVRSRGIAVEDERLLEIYAAAEADIEGGPFVPYREVLLLVFDRMADVLGFTPMPGERSCLLDSFALWPPFPDTVAALHALAERFSLNILSNVDDDLFARTRAFFPGVPFDHVVTAGRVGAYKPAPVMFETALQTIGTPVRRHLHVAQSLFHDIAPAQWFGLSTIWVDRRQDQLGWGATPEASARPDMVVPDLSTLAAWAAA